MRIVQLRRRDKVFIAVTIMVTCLSITFVVGVLLRIAQELFN